MTDRKNKGDTSEANPLDSFGIVTLASLYPVMGVLCLGFLCQAVVSVDEIKAHAAVLTERKKDRCRCYHFLGHEPFVGVCVCFSRCLAIDSVDCGPDQSQAEGDPTICHTEHSGCKVRSSWRGRRSEQQKRSSSSRPRQIACVLWHFP